ncbi:plasmid mobilization protein [Caballeronia sordidicola]|uniref:plasmid mobilization protein n=1 Tax=Caballeronia sordidicola TaxID=196367 RepID=UPI0009F88AB9|nr:plasmid mobilization relaxosome protein MobC [Caballeronia sordidicola]
MVDRVTAEQVTAQRVTAENKRGRPRKETKFDRPIAFRLPLADRDAFLAKVHESGLTQAEFFRQCVLTNRTKVIARAAPSVDRNRTVFVVNKAGNNLNQIAHVLNAARLDQSASETTYLAALDTLESIELLLRAHLKNVD